MKIAFLVLAHNEPESIIDTARFVISHGHDIIVHYDASSKESELRRIQDAFQEMGGNATILSEVHCGWGKWSLVEAPLKCLEKIKELDWKPDYVHLMSAAEHFTKPISCLEKFLTENSTFDFIEAVDITHEPWVQGGLEIERFEYYFPFSFIDQKRKFDCATWLQGALGIKREIPGGLKPRMGSQWWTLRWSTCEKIANYLEWNPLVSNYFKTTWIPDESFFQTITAHLIPQEEMAQVQLVFHWLTPTGRPYVFKNGHEEFIAGLPHFFIRKVSPHAKDLHRTLQACRTAQEASSQPPTLRQLRQSNEEARSSLRSKGSFEKEAIWSMEPPSLEDIAKYFVLIIHTESQMADVIRVCDALADSVAYLKQPFSESEELRPKNLQSLHLDSKFAVHKLIALLSSHDTRLPVASLVLGADRIPAKCQIFQDRGCLAVLLENDSKLVSEISVREAYSKRFPLEYNIPALSIGANELANELQLLKLEQDQQKQKHPK